MILLQTADTILKTTGIGTGAYVAFVAIILGVAAFIIIGTVISRRRAPRSAADIQRYSSALFRRAGKALGLSAPQIELLESLVQSCKVKQPMLLFSSVGLLDDTLRKGLYSLENARDLSEEARESRTALIYQIKGTIERNARKGAVMRSTTSLRPGQMLSITPEGALQFASKVISNMKDFLTVSVPTQPAGADSRWMRGTRLSVYFWRDNDAGYSFGSKILGYDTVKGVPSILIQHSRTLSREQRRRNRRRELMAACYYYPIRIVETGQGRKAERKAVVEQSLRTLGTLVDLSMGGCRIQTTNPLEKGKLVMVEFGLERRAPVRAFGKVMHFHRQRGRGGSMHVMFTRVTRAHLNRISEFVYDFSRPRTVAQARQQIERALPNKGGLKPLSR
jgi:c-di-GMP-binding flagellar brake protein YcgR